MTTLLGLATVVSLALLLEAVLGAQDAKAKKLQTIPIKTTFPCMFYLQDVLGFSPLARLNLLLKNAYKKTILTTILT
jgi:hypothetical protein